MRTRVYPSMPLRLALVAVGAFVLLMVGTTGCHQGMHMPEVRGEAPPVAPLAGVACTHDSNIRYMYYPPSDSTLERLFVWCKPKWQIPPGATLDDSKKP